MMKRAVSLIFALILLMSAIPAFAAGNVIYQKDAGKFIFAPGSQYSPTDLFDEFKSVMPGDSLEQAITLENKASKKVKVKIWMRALGAEEGSEEFLSQLTLKVQKAEQKGAYMFDAAASEPAQLKDWVCLGTLYSGGKVDLSVILEIPHTLTNEYSDQIGYLDWEFKVEEYPIEKDDPKTGDFATPYLWVGVGGGALLLMILLPLCKKKKKA